MLNGRQSLTDWDRFRFLTLLVGLIAAVILLFRRRRPNHDSPPPVAVIDARPSIPDLSFPGSGSLSASPSIPDLNLPDLPSATANQAKASLSRNPLLEEYGVGGEDDAGRVGEVKDGLRDRNSDRSGASCAGLGWNDLDAARGPARTAPKDVSVRFEKSLPDEMRKIDNGEGLDADSVLKNGVGGDSVHIQAGRNEGFVFGGFGFAAAGSTNAAEEHCPGEMRKMNIGSTVGNVKLVFGAKDFNHTIISSSIMTNGRTDMFLLDKVRKVNLGRDMASDTVFNGRKGEVSSPKQAGGSGSFYFGAKQQDDALGSSSVEGATDRGNFLPGELRELNVNGNLEASFNFNDGKLHQCAKEPSNAPVCGQPVSLSTPFILQSGKFGLHKWPYVSGEDSFGKNETIYRSSSLNSSDAGVARNLCDVRPLPISSSVKDKPSMSMPNHQSSIEESSRSLKEGFENGGHSYFTFCSPFDPGLNGAKKRGKSKVKSAAARRKSSLWEEKCQNDVELGVSDSCSPMDFTPYQVTCVHCQSTTETSHRFTPFPSSRGFENGGHSVFRFCSTRDSDSNGSTRMKRREPKVKSAAARSKSRSWEEIFQNDTEPGASDNCTPMDFTPYEETCVCYQSAAETTHQSTHFSNFKEFVYGGHSDFTFCSTRDPLLNGSTRMKRREPKVKSAAARSKSKSWEEIFQNDTEPGASDSCTPMDFTPYEETCVCYQSAAETTHQSTHFSNFKEFVYGGHADFTFCSTRDPLLNGSTRMKRRKPKVKSAAARSKSRSWEERFYYDAEPGNNGREQPYSTPEMQTNIRSDLSHFTSPLGRTASTGFKFTSPPSPQCAFLSARHKNRRKFRLTGNASKENDSTVFITNPEPPFTSRFCVATPIICESWRLRGSQAYSNGNFHEAEEYYTHGVNCISPNVTHESCLKTLLKCYCDRALVRMSCGRIKEALDDCLMACSYDQNFVKGQLRAANCYLDLGLIGEATKYFNNCLHTELDLNDTVFAEASDGLQKAEHASDYMNRSAELLHSKAADDISKALELTNEGLLISPRSEHLLKTKAEALLKALKYDDVIRLCEESLDSAVKNHGYRQHVNDLDIVKNNQVKIWRWNLMAKSYFYLGRLENALDMLQKLEKVENYDKHESSYPDSCASFAVILRDLLSQKAAGNRAFQAGKHLEAVEHYTAALVCNVESRPFAAICLCNRAFAYQVLGQIPDAIADCSLAIALDPHYTKAISRRATLHEMIRDFGQALYDLQSLVAYFEEKAKNKSTPLQKVDPENDLKQVRTRLNLIKNRARIDTPLDMYMILGIKQSSSGVEVRKAYHKAALRHHPDKVLPRLENQYERLWKEVSHEIIGDVNRLIKMIGDANAVLSDPTKRLQYDEEEKIRAGSFRGDDRMEEDVNLWTPA